MVAEGGAVPSDAGITALRILMVNDRPPGPGSGTEVYVDRLARALRARGHTVECFFPASPRRGVGRLGDVWDPIAARRLRARARDSDVVHVHNFARELSPAVVGAADRPTVVTVHDHRLFESDHTRGARSVAGRATRATGALARRAVRRHADVVLAVSDELRDRLVSSGIGPVDVVAPFGPERDGAAGFVPAPARGATIAYAGRLTLDKGIGVLLDAFQGVRSVHPEARLVVAGDGPERSRVVGADGVTAEGLLDEHSVGLLLASARIACVPSVAREGLPLALVEAMGSGAAVVASDLPPIRAALDGGRAGCLVAPGDVNALCVAVTGLLDDDDRARALGDAARARVAVRFSAAQAVDRTEAAYVRARRRHG